MTPVLGTTWRRKHQLPPSSCVRFERCRVTTNEDGVVERGLVCVCWVGSPPPGYPSWPDDVPMAFANDEFLAEYEPEQLSLL